MKRALLVLDSVPGTLSLDPGYEWHVLLLGPTRAELEKVLPPGRWGYFDAAAVAQAAHERVCRWVVDLVPALAKGRLKDRFWFLEFVEKNAARGDWIEELYRLALIQAAEGFELVRDERAPPAPRGSATLRYLKNAAAATVTHAVTWWLSRPFRRQRVKRAIFTFFPLFWIGGKRERFFPAWEGPWLAWLMQPRQLLRSREWRTRVIPVQARSRLTDALALWHPRWLARCLGFDLTRGWGLRFRFGGHDVSELVLAELGRSLGGREFQQNLLLEQALRRWDVDSLAYRCEFQAFENAVLAGARGRVAGFRHSAMSPFLISHRFAKGELGAQRPIPDRFWVPGPGVGRLLEDEGVDPQRIVECGPQRQPDLLRPVVPLPQEGFTVLVALGIRAVENEAVLNAMLAQREHFPELRVLIRPHPVAPHMPAELQPFVVSPEVPGLPLLAGCQAVVTPGSTMAFEAMTVGTMPIVYEEPTAYSFYSLAAYHESLFVVRDPAALRQALAQIIAKGPDDQRRRALWERTLADVLGDRQTPLARQLEQAFE